MSNPNQNIPKTGILGLKQNWRKDLKSGFLVFLLALPLCLGVALASGFPTAAGIIPAVIGGLLVSRINGTFVTITGPSAGLIVVLLAAARKFGSRGYDAGLSIDFSGNCSFRHLTNHFWIF